MSTTIQTATRRSPRVAIVGAGMSGICMAAQLARAGIETYTVFEKADRVGGTWRDNTYPGLTCDVPSRFYQYTFAPNTDWTHLFPTGAEIWSYFDRIATDFGVRDKTRFGCEVQSATFDGSTWSVTTSDGRTEEFDFVVSAAGVLHHPVYPSIPGLEEFAGAAFHSARWDHAVPITGRRVGVIGTGSTGVQIICALAGEAAETVMFQRTAQWTLPIGNRPIAGWSRWVHSRFPRFNRWSYVYWRGAFELFATALTKPGLGRRFVQAVSRRQLAKVADPELRQALTPDYQPGCKRLVVTRTLYDTVQRDDVRVVTDRIERVEEKGVRLASGEFVELDVLVLATGFDSHAYFRPMNLVGADGLTIDEAWADGPRALHTVAIPGFPNFFMLMGPNSPVGNYALTAVAEAQTGFVLQWLNRWQAGDFDTVEPTTDATSAWNTSLREAMPETVWATGCDSWYIGADGTPELFPWSPRKHRELLREVSDESHWRLRSLAVT